MQYLFQKLTILFVLFSANLLEVEFFVNEYEKESMVEKVNHIRKNGCYCGGRYMAPAKPLKWNEVLYSSALGHAKQMEKYNFFAHFSIDGKDIGSRLEQYGYNWQVAGENLGEGQDSFEEVLQDWIDSKSHCKMLMNPKVTDMAVAKHGDYWVQHFGKKMPKNFKRIGRKY